MNATEEIPELAKMLHATASNDAPRLRAISERVAELAEAAPCANCGYEAPEVFQNGAWRCPECFAEKDEEVTCRHGREADGCGLCVRDSEAADA